MLTEQDIRELLASRTENKNLDFKQGANWTTALAHEKGAVVKDILAMANTQDGGRIIFGVRDGDFEPVGLGEEEFRSFDTTRISDFLTRYADPTFGCVVSKFTIDGMRLVALEVPEFVDVPIICKADLNDPQNRLVLKRGATYIRTERATSEIVSTVETMRDLVNRAVVKRGDHLLRMVERLMKGKPLNSDDESARQVAEEIAAANQFLSANLPPEFAETGHWEVEFSLLPYEPERIPTLGAVLDVLRASQVALRGWSFPHLDRQNVSNHGRGVQSYTASVTGKVEGFRTYQSGTFVWKALYEEDTSGRVPEGQKALDFVGIILDVTEFFWFAQRLYRIVAPEGTLRGTIRLTDTRGRYLTSFGHGTLNGHYICVEPQIEVEVKATVTELMASPDELARQAIRRIYELFNWNDSTDYLMRNWQERLLNQRL